MKHILAVGGKQIVRSKGEDGGTSEEAPDVMERVCELD